MNAHQRRLDSLRRQIPEVDVNEVKSLRDSGAVLIDVREAEETVSGIPEGALCITRGFLEMRVEDNVPDLSRTVLLLCGGGTRSLYAAGDLQALGYSDVRSVRGGFSGWKEAGLPVSKPRRLADAERQRYGRHLSIPEIGESGQLKLLDSKVLLVGAGGLGSPAAFYLAAAGVGTLGLVDDDVVERSNLQRQILHTDDRVGDAKVDSAQITLNALNPDVELKLHRQRLTADNAEELLKSYDVVIDGSDNFTTRYAINDACVGLGIANVHGAIFRFDGQVSVFWPAAPGRRGPCYRCIFPAAPPKELSPSCAEAGVLGVLPGVIGTLEAIEAIKILLGIGRSLVGRLLIYDALDQRFTELSLEPDPGCPCCANAVY